MSTMSFFPVKNKTVLITGGCSKLAVNLAKELLKNGAKGISLVDMEVGQGETIIRELDNNFGKNKAIFVKANIEDIDEFDNSFSKTLESYKIIDILINNSSSITGTINGIILATEKYLKSSETMIVNLGQTNPNCSLYFSSKFAINGLTEAWSTKAKAKIIAVYPENETREENNVRNLKLMAKEFIRIVEHAPTGSVWVMKNEESSYQFILPDRFKITEKST